LGHEALRELVPGLDQAVHETVRYVRAQPGWDDSQTVCEDVSRLAPMREFLQGRLERLLDWGMEQEEALADLGRLGEHLDYCVNLELHRRKLFFADASLAWMLGQTSLDIEGRALRLPFPCFGQVFTDRSTLELAEALLRGCGGELAGRRLQILTVYVKRAPAPEGRSGLVLSMVFDAREGEWPRVLQRELGFGEDSDLDDILDSQFPDVGAATASNARQIPEMRRLVHLAVNAILYSTSADVPWPISQSPTRRLQAGSRDLGKTRKARIAHRVEELRKRYSDEDVFFLPGRIPISQLRALQTAEREPSGRELMARFLVRGHWRRANPGWHNQRVRWIEPYWKGPELSAIIEKEYKLKI
jgi:hypothetical protein